MTARSTLRKRWVILSLLMLIGLLAGGVVGLPGIASATSSYTLEATYTSVANESAMAQIEAWLQ